MKKLLIAFIAVALFSCSDDFLSTNPTEFVSSDRIGEIAEFDPSILDGFLTGVYATMYTPGTGGTTGHDDLGHKGMDIFTDMMSSDMVLAGLNYGWYRGVTDYTWLEDISNNRNYVPWRYYYRVIFQANAVIDALGGTDAVLESEASRWSMGQAKAMRAYGYFYLSQLLQTDYDPNEAILPIYLSVSANTPQAPMGEVMALIEDDLTEAIDYLDTFDRGGKFEVNKPVAQGLLAYAYAAQGKYAEALPLCQDIINNGGFTLVQDDEITGGFNEVTTPGWMWGANITPDIGLNLVSWWGKVDIFTYSYAWAGDPKTIDESLFNQMRPSDKRIAQWGNASYGPYVPSQKFWNPDRTIGGSSADNNTMDYIYMRVAEFHLLGAESAAKSGNEGMARTMLKNFVSTRVDDASYVDGLSGGALIGEISFQTRMELWGEGKSYLLMKRNDESRTRGSNHILLSGATIAHDEPRATFLIPQQESLNNPFITD
mgnify:CR=1 FL=1